MLRSEQTLNVDWSWLEQVRGSHGRGPPAARDQTRPRRNRHGRRPTAYGTSTTRYSVWCLCRRRLAHTSWWCRVVQCRVVLEGRCQEKCRNALYIARCGGLLGVWRAVVWHPLLVQRTGYAFIRYPASNRRLSVAGLAASLALTVLANHGHRQRSPRSGASQTVFLWPTNQQRLY